MQVDIIGGGISGLSAAIALKKNNPQAEVIVHEKHGEIGNNLDARKCGEAHSIESFSLRFAPPPGSVASMISEAETIVGRTTYRYQRTKDTAWILNRPVFISYLGNTALDLGVILQKNDRISDVAELSSDFIIDASGCPSPIRRKLHLPLRFVGVGYQETISDCSVFEPGLMKIVFDKRGGYFWVFPRRSEFREVNVGVGFFKKQSLNLDQVLSVFKKEYDISGWVEHRTAGLIPFGVQYPLRKNNILFVGDAGVGTFPLDGQGIYRALMSGEAAGRHLAASNPAGYVTEMLKMFIKWDLIGKLFLRSVYATEKINKNGMLHLWNVMQLLSNRFGLFESKFNMIQKSIS